MTIEFTPRKDCVHFDFISEEEERGGIILPESTTPQARAKAITVGAEVDWIESWEYNLLDPKKTMVANVNGKDYWVVRGDGIFAKFTKVTTEH